jgi:hypothetical protein
MPQPLSFGQLGVELSTGLALAGTNAPTNPTRRRGVAGRPALKL